MDYRYLSRGLKRKDGECPYWKSMSVVIISGEKKRVALQPDSTEGFVMIPVKRILHPTDFSACARGALAYALELAVRFGAELHVLHILEGTSRRAAAPDPARLAEANLDIRLREMLNPLLARLEAGVRESLHVEYSLGRDTAPAPAIVQYADTRSIDLMVMGTHGRRGLRRLLLGSVITEVLHESSCDVLAVRSGHDVAAEPPWRKRILVPLDLTATSVVALQGASAIADQLQARLTLLHVIEPSPLPLFSAGQGDTFGVLLPNLRQAARIRLEGLREEADIHSQIDLYVDEGPPALIITDFAEEQDIDLIVMKARSQEEKAGSRLGSVTERVIRRAFCPVWVMKSHIAANREEYRQPSEERLAMTA